MKRIKKLLVALTAFVLCILPILSTPITAHAEGEPVTYHVRYVADLNEWRYQTGSWEENGYHRELYYLKQNIKDGDLLVVDGTEELRLELDVYLNNLTVANCPIAAIQTKGVENFYGIFDSVTSVTGDVNYAEVYDGCTANFNNNVKTLKMLSERHDTLAANIAVAGTLDHLYAAGKNYTHFEFYNFAENTLRIEDGFLKTDASNYSTAPVAATPAPEAAAGAPAPAAPAAPSDEYDEVPKTADIRFNPLWLVGMGMVCFAGSYVLKKEK